MSKSKGRVSIKQRSYSNPKRLDWLSQPVTLIVLFVVSAGFFFWLGMRLSSPSYDGSSKFVTHYDFETQAELGDWDSGAQISEEHSFSGQKAIKVFLPVTAAKETTFYLNWKHQFRADVVVGQVYWLGQEDVSVEWAQVCVPLEDWSCKFISIEGGWNTFVLDLSEIKTPDGEGTLNELDLTGIVLQGVLQTENPDLKNTPIFVDSIQLYVNGQE